MGEAAVPVATHLLVLLQQLHRQQQQIIEIQRIVRRQRPAVAAVHIGGELAPLTFSVGLKLIRQPALVLGVADGPAGLLRLEPLGIELQFLGDDLLHQALGIGLVVDRELLGPAQPLSVLELVDVVAEHPREQGVEGADPQLLADLAVDA